MQADGTRTVLNKIDLLAYLRFEVEHRVAAAREINPRIEVSQSSARTGEGMEAWYGWLESRRARSVPEIAFGLAHPGSTSVDPGPGQTAFQATVQEARA